MNIQMQQALAAIFADPLEGMEQFATQRHPGEGLLSEKQADSLVVAAILTVATMLLLSVFVRIMY